MNRTLTALFISVDKHITGLFTIDCGTYNTPDMKPLEIIHLQGLTAAQTYAEACKINEKWSTTGQVIPYLQKEAELPILKERAAATANSDHPATETLHKPKYSISTRQMQERLSSNNGRVLRCINLQRSLYSPLKGIAAILKENGISAKDIYKSIGYLSTKGYISISRNHKAVIITAQGIQLLAGSIQDSRVTI